MFEATCEAGPLIVEDFYSDPEGVRRFALKQRFDARAGAKYPGLTTLGGFGAHAVAESVARILRRSVQAYGGSGAFRLTLQGDDGRRRVHVDEPPIAWSVVIYLGKPTNTVPGTVFYRHPQNGLYGAPEDDASARSVGFPDRRAAVEMLLADDRPETWHQADVVEARFNRLVVFRSSLFHAMGEPFGDSPEAGRLVHVFFFSETDGRSVA
jgi:Family of unknown function (DUF6445)